MQLWKMPKDDIWSSTSICTTSQTDDLRRVIDVLSDSLYKTGKRNWEETVASTVAAPWAAYFDIPAPGRKTYLDGLRDKLSHLAVLRLGVAVDLPQGMVEQICAWARANVAPDVILDIEVDPGLVAGAQISWQGKYVDLSKRTQLENELKTQSSKLKI